MSKKSKQKSKAQVTTENLANVTGHANKALKAIKEGKAKPVAEPIHPSEFAVDGEDPKWGAQLDGFRESDLAAGMTPKSMRVQRQQRVRKLAQGMVLTEGGVLNVAEPQLELAVAETPPTPEAKLSKKERKAERKAVLAQQLAGTREALKVTPPEPTPIVKTTPDDATGARTRAPRTDTLLKLLEQAQESANLDGTVQTVECPRHYTTKNYGVQLVKKYSGNGLNLSFLDDTFIDDGGKGKWSVRLVVSPTQTAQVQVQAPEAKGKGKKKK